MLLPRPLLSANLGLLLPGTAAPCCPAPEVKAPAQQSTHESSCMSADINASMGTLITLGKCTDLGRGRAGTQADTACIFMSRWSRLLDSLLKCWCKHVLLHVTAVVFMRQQLQDARQCLLQVRQPDSRARSGAACNPYAKGHSKPSSSGCRCCGKHCSHGFATHHAPPSHSTCTKPVQEPYAPCSSRRPAASSRLSREWSTKLASPEPPEGSALTGSSLISALALGEASLACIQPRSRSSGLMNAAGRPKGWLSWLLKTVEDCSALQVPLHCANSCGAHWPSEPC